MNQAVDLNRRLAGVEPGTIIHIRYKELRKRPERRRGRYKEIRSYGNLDELVLEHSEQLGTQQYDASSILDLWIETDP